MAGSAGLVLRRLVVRRSNRLARRKVGRRRVALQAKRVHARPIDQPRIGSAMREVASCAALRLHDEVFIGKRPRRLAVALRADRIHLCRCAQILPVEGPVRVVAVRALHQAFFHLVVERHVELRLRICVALEAKLRLLNLQQLLSALAMVNTVAADAAHVVLTMCRAFKICMLPLVTAQTPRINLFRGRLGRVEDLRDIPATIDVRLPRSVTAFARHARLSVHLR